MRFFRNLLHRYCLGTLMKPEFINGWDRLKLADDKYQWSCRYCGISTVTHYDDLYHGCQLREYGLGDLVASCLTRMKITKRLVTFLLRKVSKDKKVKCACGERLRIVNKVGRALGINYILTTLRHGQTPRQFVKRRAAASAPENCHTTAPLACHTTAPHRPPQGRR